MKASRLFGCPVCKVVVGTDAMSDEVVLTCAHGREASRFNKPALMIERVAATTRDRELVDL